jgi:hypothetical protein
MTSFRSSSLLHQALLADAAISGATGLLMLLGAGLLASLLGLPEALLRFAGLILLPYGVLVAYLGTRESPPRPAVWAVIAVNALWAADSILLLLSGWVAPNALGHVFVAAQALVVLIFAELQYIGMRRFAATAAA